MEKYEKIKDKILDTLDQVFGEVYMIKNTINGKCYIGQVRSHRLNHSKYRPFGTLGRFKDHLNEALCNTKKKQCTYLNSAIRKYGKDTFTVETLIRCPLEKLDEIECEKIKEHNTMFPSGYNLTKGGKTFKTVEYNSNELNGTNIKEKKYRKYQTDETKNKISSRLKEHFTKNDLHESHSNRTVKQHLSNKFDKFVNVNIDLSNIDKYIKKLNSKFHVGYKVIIDGKRADFLISRSKLTSENIENTRARAIEFIQQLCNDGNNQIGLGNPQPSSPPSYTAEEGEGSETKWESVSDDGLASLRELKI